MTGIIYEAGFASSELIVSDARQEVVLKSITETTLLFLSSFVH